MQARAPLVIVSFVALLGCHASTSDGAQAPPKSDQSGAPPAVERADSDAAPAETTAAAPEADQPAPPGPPVGDVDELKELEGKPEAEVLAALGEPTTKREFQMRECCTEFQIEIYNTYPPGAGHDDVLIREWTWDYEGYAVTIWLHEHDGAWLALDTCRYSDDVEF
jgi:hypothetical protein